MPLRKLKLFIDFYSDFPYCAYLCVCEVMTSTGPCVDNAQSAIIFSCHMEGNHKEVRLHLETCKFEAVKVSMMFSLTCGI